MGRIWNDDAKDEQQKNDEQQRMTGILSGAAVLKERNAEEDRD